MVVIMMLFYVTYTVLNLTEMEHFPCSLLLANKVCIILLFDNFTVKAFYNITKREFRKSNPRKSRENKIIKKMKVLMFLLTDAPNPFSQPVCRMLWLIRCKDLCFAGLWLAKLLWLHWMCYHENKDLFAAFCGAGSRTRWQECFRPCAACSVVWEYGEVQARGGRP